MAATNCQPGQMAIVVRGFPAQNVGKIIRCVAVDDFASTICMHPMWTYEGELIGHMGGRSMAVADGCLRPLRNPGDDAVDEMVQRVGPAPMTLTELLRGEETAHG
jgi:hypothetical protein